MLQRTVSRKFRPVQNDTSRSLPVIGHFILFCECDWQKMRPCPITPNSCCYIVWIRHSENKWAIFTCVHIELGLHQELPWRDGSNPCPNCPTRQKRESVQGPSQDRPKGSGHHCVNGRRQGVESIRSTQLMHNVVQYRFIPVLQCSTVYLCSVCANKP